MKLTKTEAYIMSEIARCGRFSVVHGVINHSSRTRGVFGGRMVDARNKLVAKGLIKVVASHSSSEPHRGRTNVLYESVVVAA